MSPATLEVMAAETLADALSAAIVEPAYVSVVEVMMARYLEANGIAVPLRDAAHALEVTLPTVRDWVARGVLVEVPDMQFRSVSIPSLAVVLVARGLSDHADDARPLARIIDQMRDVHLLQWARSVADATSSDDFIEYSEADLAELERL